MIMMKLNLICAALVAIQACSILPEQASNANAKQASTGNADTSAPVAAAKPLVRYGNFPTDTLYALLVAEMAASRRQFDVTLDNYVAQANMTNDLGVIARAARIAQFFNADQQALDMGLLWLEREPENIEANTLVANAYLVLKQPLKAVAHLEALLNKSTTQEHKALHATQAAMADTIANSARRTDPTTRQALIKRYQQLSLQYPHFVNIKTGLSVMTLAEGDRDTAMGWVEQALELDPDNTSAIIQQVTLLQQKQQLALATEILQEKLAQQPKNSRLRLTYARLLTQTDIEAAYTQFTLLSEASPKQLDLLFSRALIAAELNKLEEAQPLLERLLAVNYRPDATRFYLGHVAESQNKTQLALTYYLAVTQGADLLSARNRAGRIMIQQGDLAQAKQLFTALRASHPKQKAAIYVTESDLLILSKHIDESLMLLNQALDEFPDNFDLRYNRSTIYEQQDKLALMESDLRHILTLDPNNATALNGLGYFLSTRTQRFDEALVLIQKALTIKPKNPAILDSMGWVLFKLGRHQEAITYLQQAFDIFPDPEIAAHLGEALWVTGKTQAAKTIWQNNLQQNPDDARIIDTLKRLDVSL